MYPIEMQGWFKSRFDGSTEFYKNKNLSVYIQKNGDLHLSTDEVYPLENVSYDELRALWETAKQIKEEGELEEKTSCNKSANKGAIKNEVL